MFNFEYSVGGYHIPSVCYKDLENRFQFELGNYRIIKLLAHDHVRDDSLTFADDESRSKRLEWDKFSSIEIVFVAI